LWLRRLFLYQHHHLKIAGGPFIQQPSNYYDMIFFYRPFAVLLLPLIAHSLTPSPAVHHNARREGRAYRSDAGRRSTTSSGLSRNTLLHAFQLPPGAGQTPERQPLLARAYSRALIAAIRCGSLLFGTERIEELGVRCEASSNRNVALGRLSHVQISFKSLSSPFLKTGDFQLVGRNLELGTATMGQPIIFLATPFLLLWNARRTLSLLLCLFLLPPGLVKKISREKKRKVSVLTYRLGLSGDDLSSPNTVLRMAVHKAMDYLLRNSVVGVLTESALAAAQAQTSTTPQGEQTPQDQMVQLAAALDDNAGATKLELQRVSIGDKGRLELDAVAAFPDASTGSTSQLDFIVRLALSPLDEDLVRITPNDSNDPQDRATIVRPDRCGIMATNAELKASFNRDTMMGMPLEIFGKPIPDIWIPVVSGGLAFPLGYRHRVQSVETNASQNRLDVCGEIYFNGDAPTVRKSVWGTMPFLGSSPPPRVPNRPT
jgi:hypothetical protein